MPSSRMEAGRGGEARRHLFGDCCICNCQNSSTSRVYSTQKGDTGAPFSALFSHVKEQHGCPTGRNARNGGNAGGGTPLHAKTTAQIGITEHPQFFGMKISVMDAIQDEPFERFMSYFLMQIPMEGLVVLQFQILRNNKQF